MSALICTDIIVGVCTSLVLVRRAVNPNCSQQTCPHPACLLNVIPTREEPGLLGWVSDLAKKKKSRQKERNPANLQQKNTHTTSFSLFI
jgi:hypothetical protein